MDYRATDDLDLALAISLERLSDLLAGLDDWKPHEKMEHRFFSPQGQMVDVLPASADLIEQGFIEWPSGHRMSLMGFDLAFDTSIEQPVGDGIVVQVASATAIAFLKMRAWLDRPEERRKDLQDIAHLLEVYVGDDDDRRWEDDVVEVGMDFEDVSPWILGRDLRSILQAHHRPHIDEFLGAVRPEQLTALGPTRWFTAEAAERALAAFRQGLGDL